jgi:hypothetical protein
MKYFLIALIFCFQNSFGQTDSTIKIKELGWTIQLPPDLKVIDTATLGTENRNLHKTWIKKPPVDSNSNYNRPVFLARDSSRYTLFSIYYVDSLHDPLNGEFPEYAYSGVITIRKKMSTVAYNGVKFEKLQLNGYPEPGRSYVGVMLKTKYQGKTFNITYSYTDPIKGNEIEQMLISSKFDR